MKEVLSGIAKVLLLLLRCFAGLAEVLMRLFLSFLQHPSTPTVIDDQLRAWSSTGPW